MWQYLLMYLPETTPGSKKGPEIDAGFKVSASHGDSSVVVHLDCQSGEWFPKTSAELFDALYDAGQYPDQSDQPSNVHMALAMEIMYKEAWWLNMLRAPELFPMCDVSKLLTQPSEVYEAKFLVDDQTTTSALVYWFTQSPPDEPRINSLRDLFRKMLIHTPVPRLVDLERILSSHH